MLDHSWPGSFPEPLSATRDAETREEPLAMSQTFYAADSCSECNLQAAGRCPTCRHSLCVNHFPLDRHEPCTTRLAAGRSRSRCYVCGSPVTPVQWSASAYAHYVDTLTCAGCGRQICDTHHTRLRGEVVKVAREGMRTSRYHVTQRYCDVCAPVRRFGGVVGAAWWVAGLTSAGAAAFFLFVR